MQSHFYADAAVYAHKIIIVNVKFRINTVSPTVLLLVLLSIYFGLKTQF